LTEWTTIRISIQSHHKNTLFTDIYRVYYKVSQVWKELRFIDYDQTRRSKTGVIQMIKQGRPFYTRYGRKIVIR
jgi:hypothetical protein